MQQPLMRPLVDHEIDSTCASQIWHVGGNAPVTKLVTGSLNMWKAGLRIHARSALASGIGPFQGLRRLLHSTPRQTVSIR